MVGLCFVSMFLNSSKMKNPFVVQFYKLKVFLLFLFNMMQISHNCNCRGKNNFIATLTRQL